MLKLLFNRSRKVVSLICALALTVCCTTLGNKTDTVYAASATDNFEAIESNGEVTTYGSYHTFYKFPAGSHVGAFSFDFNVNKSCQLKFMYAAKYANGQSGSLTYVLQKKNGISGVYIDGSSVIDGRGHSVLFRTAKLPAGNYNLMIIPNDPSTTLAFNGEVYTLSY